MRLGEAERAVIQQPQTKQLQKTRKPKAPKPRKTPFLTNMQCPLGTKRSGHPALLYSCDFSLLPCT